MTCTSPSDSFPDDGNPSDTSWGSYYLQMLPAPFHLETPTHQPSCTLQRPLRRSIDSVRAYQLAPRMTTVHDMRSALMAQQARLRPERQAICHPTPIITQRCNTRHIRPDKGYTRCIRFRRCRLPLMPCLPSVRIEELANCHLYRLLKGTPIPVGRLRRRHTYHRLPTFYTDESHRTNHYHYLHSLPVRIFPTGPTLPYKPGLCSFTSYYCITNFEYSLAFASRASHPIISKATNSPVAHYAQPFQSRVPRPRACLFDTTSPTSATFTILHLSPECLLLP